MSGTPIEAYLGNVFSQINAYMRGVEQPTDEYIRYCYDHINEIIYCDPVLTENIVVYRAIGRDTLNISMNSVKEHDGYMEKGFMSTPLLKETLLEEFPSYTELLKIYVPKGAHVLGVDFIKDRKYSSWSNNI